MDDEREEATRDGVVVSSLDDGRITFDVADRTRGDTRDPVCGTRLPNTSGPTATHRGVTYHFCGEMCRHDFIHDPTRYVHQP